MLFFMIAAVMANWLVVISQTTMTLLPTVLAEAVQAEVTQAAAIWGVETWGVAHQTLAPKHLFSTTCLTKYDYPLISIGKVQINRGDVS